MHKRSERSKAPPGARALSESKRRKDEEKESGSERGPARKAKGSGRRRSNGDRETEREEERERGGGTFIIIIAYTDNVQPRPTFAGVPCRFSGIHTVEINFRVNIEEDARAWRADSCSHSPFAEQPTSAPATLDRRMTLKSATLSSGRPRARRFLSHGIPIFSPSPAPPRTIAFLALHSPIFSDLRLALSSSSSSREVAAARLVGKARKK